MERRCGVKGAEEGGTWRHSERATKGGGRRCARMVNACRCLCMTMRVCIYVLDGKGVSGYLSVCLECIPH